MYPERDKVAFWDFKMARLGIRIARREKMGDFLRGLPKPHKPIEIQDNLAMRLDLKKLHPDTFYKFDYNGRELIARINKQGMLEVHELVYVQ
jgi:hypothetical protein